MSTKITTIEYLTEERLSITAEAIGQARMKLLAKGFGTRCPQCKRRKELLMIGQDKLADERKRRSIELQQAIKDYDNARSKSWKPRARRDSPLPGRGYADMKPRTRRRSKSGQRRAAAKRWWVR